MKEWTEALRIVLKFLGKWGSIWIIVFVSAWLWKWFCFTHFAAPNAVWIYLTILIPWGLILATWAIKEFKRIDRQHQERIDKIDWKYNKPTIMHLAEIELNIDSLTDIKEGVNIEIKDGEKVVATGKVIRIEV